MSCTEQLFDNNRDFRWTFLSVRILKQKPLQMFLALWYHGQLSGMGPLLFCRKVRVWSIFRYISSSGLKTCQTHTLLVFVFYLARTKYANEVTWLATPPKAWNYNGHTFSCFHNFSTFCMILRPLGISFLRLAMSRFLKGKACYIGRLGTSRKNRLFSK